MARSDRLIITISGDLARLLSLEASRGGRPPQEIAVEILSRSLKDLAAGRSDAPGNGRESQNGPTSEEMNAVRLVLSKAYGPSRRPTKSRRSRTRG
jgi:hypothetical protein